MKKIFYLLTLFILMLTVSVKAKNNIYKIDMDIYLNEKGDANITERWDVKGDDGSEWFKQITNLGESEITNFTVLMDSTPLAYKNWNVNEGLGEKKGYYGINKTSDGIELCFGKSDYNRHLFTLNYTMSKFVFNTLDSQVLVWRLINNTPGINFENFKITIRSYYSFPDTLDVWGTGYKGLAYVNNGVITLSNEENPIMGEESYAVVLVKFPLNTFDTNYQVPKYEMFDDVKEAFLEGSYDPNKMSTLEKIGIFVGGISVFAGIVALVNYSSKKNGYGYINNKTINKKDTPAFHDIPCNKDIFYANTLIKLNAFEYKDTNIFGAIILKWVKEEKIVFKKEEKEGLFKSKEVCTIDLTKKPTFTNDNEARLFDMMYSASTDGILESNEFKKWVERNYNKFISVFESLVTDEERALRSSGHIYNRKNKAECKYYNVMDDTMYEDAKRLLGLKIFLKEFSNIRERETIEVHLWDEYLMFAYLFGIADKVAKQLKDLYPELVEQNDIDYPTLVMINNFSNQTVSAALAAARNYSSGGGGFSSMGGGGGSFGGGISGSR